MTTYKGSESDPALSPDAATVAFSWDGPRGGNSGIYLLPLEGGTPRRLATSPDPDSNPAWSPDGKRLAFLRGEGRLKKLMLADANGAAPEMKLAELAALTLSWTADGSAILAEDTRGELDTWQVVSVSARTGEKTALTPKPDSLWPTALPGGGFIYGLMLSNARVDLWLVPSGGGAHRLLVEGRRADGAPAVSPGGREIVFAADPTGRPMLYRATVNEAGPAHPQWLSSLGDGVSHPSLVQNALGTTRLVYERRSSDLDIQRIDLATGAESQLIAGTRNETNPQFSPDGRHIAYSSDRSGSWEVWVAGIDGTSPRQLTKLERRRGGLPRYSPDGRYISFDTLSPDTDFDVHVISAEGGEVRQLTASKGEDGRSSWSHDGRVIYFFSERSGSRQIWRVPFPNGEPVQVTRNGGYEAFESPDGKRLYYVADQNRPGLRKVPVEGGPEVDIAAGVHQGYWALSANAVYYLDFNQQTPTGTPVRRLDLSTGRESTVAMVKRRFFRPAPGLAVSPDGRVLALATIADLGSDLMLVNDFR